MSGGRVAAVWVALSERRAFPLLALGVLVAAAGAVGSVRLYSDLRADLSELLPRDAGSARDVEVVTGRVGGWAEETVALHGPDARALRVFADELAPRLSSIPGLVDSVEYRIDDVQRFFAERRWLFIKLEDLQALRDRIQARVRWELQAAFPLLKAPDRPPPSIDEVVERIKRGSPSSELLERFPDGYFGREVKGPDGARTQALVLRVRMAGNPNDFAQIAAVDRAVRQTVATLKAERPSGTVAVSFGGYVASTVFEHDGLAEDLVVASLLVALAIALALALYYRTVKAIVAIGLPLMAGALATFGVAELLIGHLNSNTAFLGSIVIGNGVNFGLILFARYAEERRKGALPRDAMTVAVATTWLATLTASLAAAIAYGSLVVTDFRGFAQFGVIGFTGMALCWLATYGFTPALVLAWERRGTLIGPGATRYRPIVMDRLAGLVERWPRAVLVTAAALAIPSAIFLARFAADPIEYDFGKLRDSRALRDGGPAFWEDAVFGGHHDPCVVLAKDADEARAVAAAIEAWRVQHPEGAIGQVVSIASFEPADQEAKLPIIEGIRALATDSVLELAPPEERARIAAVLPPEGLRPFSASELPPMLLRRLTERNGTVGTPVLVYPAAWVNVWDGHHAMKVAKELRSVPLPRPDIPMASSLLVFSDVLEAVVRDGPRATGVSFAGVVVLVGVMFGVGARRLRRFSDSALVLGTLCAGLLLFGGLAGALSLKLSLLSFIALPITFGIGADYAANMVQRRRVSGASFVEALRTTGGAVALCSLTTIIGYSSLLVAHNQALVSFGILADLGELACLATALVVLPALSRGQSSPESSNTPAPK
ncbi:MAG: MMPL family transporter [Myxococcaceae bacterium]